MSDVAAFGLYNAVHAATILTGYGAKRFGGRCNPPDVAMVYCSSFCNSYG